MIPLNSQPFLRDGFVILREVVPADRLAELRDSFEILVERQRTIWARDRKPQDPPGGAWETLAQPRLFFNDLVDRATANAVEFCLHENTFGVSQALMRGRDTAITGMFFMCSPARDHGPAKWHRDVSSGLPAPLEGMQAILRHYGPHYVQWNIALYDDNVLWVVPGSHLRPNTEEEDQCLATDPKVPLPGSIPVELGAGDGVVYALPILHWASNYSIRIRRIIHLGYRSFGGNAFSYVHWRHWDPDFIPSLSPAALETFERFNHLWQREHDVIESAWRAMIRKDAAGFHDHLLRLHPGPHGRMVSVVMLSKLAFMMRDFKQLDVENLPADERRKKMKASWYGASVLFDNLDRRFSPSETDQLCERFEILDEKLKWPGERPAPGFQRGPSKYRCNEMPANFEVEDFIASWEKP